MSAYHLAEALKSADCSLKVVGQELEISVVVPPRLEAYLSEYGRLHRTASSATGQSQPIRPEALPGQGPWIFTRGCLTLSG
jgi:hypothetical protein